MRLEATIALQAGGPGSGRKVSGVNPVAVLKKYGFKQSPNSSQLYEHKSGKTIVLDGNKFYHSKSKMSRSYDDRLGGTHVRNLETHLKKAFGA